MVKLKKYIFGKSKEWKTIFMSFIINLDFGHEKHTAFLLLFFLQAVAFGQV